MTVGTGATLRLRAVGWRGALALSAVVGATALMWSDGAVGVWKAIVDFALRSNGAVTETVMGARMWGDADLHVLVWGAVALCVLLAMPSAGARWRATICLVGWSWFVELAQPWFTDIRSRQFVDALGNTIGIVGMFLLMTLWARTRHRRAIFAGSERTEGMGAELR